VGELRAAQVLRRLGGLPGDVRQGIAVQNVARFLENVADHATAIAEHAIFMVHALDVRHAGKRDR
jgi:phosphate transport system protein